VDYEEEYNGSFKAGFQNLINDGSIADAKNTGPNAGY
jgi:hypothetical protein